MALQAVKVDSETNIWHIYIQCPEQFKYSSVQAYDNMNRQRMDYDNQPIPVSRIILHYDEPYEMVGVHPLHKSCGAPLRKYRWRMLHINTCSDKIMQKISAVYKHAYIYIQYIHAFT